MEARTAKTMAKTVRGGVDEAGALVGGAEAELADSQVSEASGRADGARAGEVRDLRQAEDADEHVKLHLGPVALARRA